MESIPKASSLCLKPCKCPSHVWRCLEFGSTFQTSLLDVWTIVTPHWKASGKFLDEKFFISIISFYMRFEECKSTEQICCLKLQTKACIHPPNFPGMEPHFVTPDHKLHFALSQGPNYPTVHTNPSTGSFPLYNACIFKTSSRSQATS